MARNYVSFATFLVCICQTSGFCNGASSLKSLQSRVQTNTALHSTLLIDPNFNLVIGSAIFAAQFSGIETVFLRGNSVAQVIGNTARVLKFAFGVFAIFLTYQTSTLRFSFDDQNNFSLVKADGNKIGDNVVVGGENSWNCKNFVNYAFLPGEKFPILVYFKEIQTPKENWVQG